jgi:16S rRNA (uracil1498-N3)-methyltransferase
MRRGRYVNLVLLFPGDFVAESVVRLSGRRLEHIQQVQGQEVGDELRVGVVNGELGLGRITAASPEYIELEVELGQLAPPALPVTLILGLPRPRMLKRTLQTITAMGVKELYLVNSYRVEKSYWQTPILTDEGLLEHLTLGLEQAVDTHMPRVHLRKLFKPFVEDELPALAAQTRALVAHPYCPSPLPEGSLEPTTLAIGTEGGWIDYEVGKLVEAGLQTVQMGPRILRVENAVPALLARLLPLA